jgi:hypothetical protein
MDSNRLPKLAAHYKKNNSEDDCEVGTGLSLIHKRQKMKTDVHNSQFVPSI